MFPDLRDTHNNSRMLQQTKLHQPHVTRQLVPRPRLWERLDRGLDGGLILVSAGAGYGKTTLISSWLESRAAAPGEQGAALPTAWLSLDEYDSDLNVFLRYCGAALRTIFPEAFPETLSLIQAPQPLALATLVATLSNELESLPEDFILVLDDYHTINGEDVPDLLASLARHWPRRLHLVLITRHNPALPIASLRAKGQLTEIRARDLRFTTEEVGLYVGRVLEKPLGQPVLALLEQRTEGWIAGLYLATLALRQEGVTAALTALTEADTNIADYLIADVLARQPLDILQFLLRTSILDRWCVPLCEQLIGSSSTDRSVPARLEWLERTNFFIIQLDDRREWYRYHHLLRDVLQRRAQATLGSDQISGLHRQAAAWFEQQGWFEEALQHTLAARDLDQAARLMQHGLRDVLNREDRATLERWLHLLPEDFIQQRPWLLMIKCLALQFTWQLGAIAPLLTQIEALLENTASDSIVADLPILRGLVLALQGELAFFSNQAEQSVACVQAALALLPESWTYGRGGYMLFLGLSMQALGRGRIIDGLLWAQYEALREKTNTYAVRILFSLCVNDVQAGRLEQARQRGELMLEQATRGRLPLLQGWAHYWLGVIHYMWNDLAAAARHFRAVTDQRFVINVLAARQGVTGLVLVQLAQGEAAAAGETLALLSQYEAGQFGAETDWTRSLRARWQLATGDRSTALRWADSFTLPIPDVPLLWIHDAYLTKAHVLLARGTVTDMQAALQIVEALSEIAARTHNLRFTIATKILQALGVNGQGQIEAALAALQDAIDLARPGGFMRVFVDPGARLQPLLSCLAQRCPGDDFVGRLLTAFPASAPLTPPRLAPAAAPIVEPLTARELDVLLLMREHLSNKEIAQRLHIAPVTVKRHAANVYQKLGVNKRWDAVAKAEALRILAPR
jgi:LuxR family transcriptional regulator, maltose regulon positive regulatory protein